MSRRVEGVARELQDGVFRPEAGKAKLMETRKAVVNDWIETAASLRAQGKEDLARQVELFVKGLPPVRTEREQIAAGLLAQLEAQRRRAAEGRADGRESDGPRKRGG